MKLFLTAFGTAFRTVNSTEMDTLSLYTRGIFL